MALSGGFDHFASAAVQGSLSGGFDHTASAVPGSSLSGGFDHDVSAIPAPLSGPFDHLASEAAPAPTPGEPVVSMSSAPLLGVEAGIGRFLPQDFEIRRGFEGPQIIIRWEEPLEPDDVVSFTLVRRLYGFPRDITDGTVVYTGGPIAANIADLDVDSCAVYYYKLFVTTSTGSIVSNASVEAEIKALSTGRLAADLFDSLPRLFQQFDGPMSEAEDPRLALAEGTDGILPEVYNFDEDGSVLRGPLERTLKIMGPMLDEVKGLIDCFPNELDVDTAMLKPLEQIASLLGLPLNKELEPQKMRDEVRYQAQYLTLKGTIPGLELRFRAVASQVPTITEQCDRILYANDVTRTSPEFTAEEAANIGGANDVLFYSVSRNPDRPNFWLWYYVFVTITAGVDEETARKWCTSVVDSSPACHTGFLTLENDQEDAIEILIDDEALEDEYFTDDEDAIPVVQVDEDFGLEQTPVPGATLIVGDTSHTLNAPNWTSVLAPKTLP